MSRRRRRKKSWKSERHEGFRKRALQRRHERGVFSRLKNREAEQLWQQTRGMTTSLDDLPAPSDPNDSPYKE